jgi:hypothetical protein
MNFRMAMNLQFVIHLPNMFEDLIGVIKLGSKFLVVVVFEGGILIRLQMKEHIIPLFKLVF